MDSARDQRFDMKGRQALTRPLRPNASRYQVFGDVIAIADALLYRMSGRQRLALRIVDKPGEQAYVVTTVADSTIDPVCRQDRLHLPPKVGINDWRVLAWIGLVFIHDLSVIEAVL